MNGLDLPRSESYVRRISPDNPPPDLSACGFCKKLVGVDCHEFREVLDCNGLNIYGHIRTHHSFHARCISACRARFTDEPYNLIILWCPKCLLHTIRLNALILDSIKTLNDYAVAEADGTVIERKSRSVTVYSHMFELGLTNASIP